MNENKILRSICTDNWYAKCYAEYLQDVHANFEKLISLCEQAINAEDINDVLDVATTYGFNTHCNVPVGNGYVVLINLLQQLDQLSKKPEGPDDLDQIAMDYGNNVSFSDILNMLGDTNTSLVGLRALYDVMAQEITNVSDRITFFKDRVATIIGDRFDLVANSMEYYSELIRANLDITQINQQIIGSSAANDDNINPNDTKYLNSDLCNYTGADPIAAVDFSNASSLANAVATTGAKMAKSIFNAIGSGAKWLFNKVKNYVVDTVVDPDVVTYMSGGNGTIEGFAWTGTSSIGEENTGALQHDTDDLIAPIIQHYSDKWVKLDTMFGEILFRLDKRNDGTFEYYYKPKAFNVDNAAFKTSFPVLKKGFNHDTAAEIASALGDMKRSYQLLDNGSTKQQLATSLCFCNDLMYYVGRAAMAEEYLTITNSNSLLGYFSKDVDGAGGPERQMLFQTCTNADVVRFSSGYITSTGEKSDVLVGAYNGSPLYYEHRKMKQLVAPFVLAWLYSRLDRSNNPTNYTFVPYSNDTIALSDSSWAVKSDSEIENTMNNFITNAVIITVVVAAAVTTGIIAKKISFNLAKRRDRILLSANLKAVLGDKMTIAEKRAYLKNVKLNKASRVMRGLPFEISDVGSVSSLYRDDFNNLSLLIAG